jgi:lipopolysaccharide/colanic/teichoic acid biosynthesis glycosyltransferase
MTKRLFDFILGCILFFLLLPFFVIISAILLLTGEGKVFYLQKRIGLNNETFKIIKFATMLANSEKIGTGSITIKNDPRVLPVGKFLRKTKINEIPQIINVLIGDMSFVGPRPQMQRDFEKFPKKAQEVMYMSTRPGITGLGSVFFRDEERWISECEGDKHVFYKEKIAPYKSELELWYGRHQTLALDIKILFITAIVVLFPDSSIMYRVIKNLPEKPSFLK